MEIKEIKIADLKPAKYNPRTITEKEFKGLKKSLEMTYKCIEVVVFKLSGTFFWQ